MPNDSTVTIMQFCAKLFLVLQCILIGGAATSGVYVNVTGNIIVGAMFPVHGAVPGSNCSSQGGTGGLIDQSGIQNLEALLFSLGRANADILKDTGLELGVLAFDTCYSEMVALESALQMVRLQHNFVDSNSYVCPGDGGPPSPKNAGKIIGVIGAASSGVSIQLASFLRLFQIPQISYSSTSPELSDTTRYDYFMRTVASDTYQAQAIVQILKVLTWRYVTVVFEDTSYGKLGSQEILKQTHNTSICVARSIEVKRYYSTDEEKQKELGEVVDILLKFNNTEGQVIVILFMSMYLVEGVFELVSKRALQSDIFIWLGTDAWVIVILFMSMDLVEGVFELVSKRALQSDIFIWLGTDAWAGRPIRAELQHVAKNALGVQPLIQPVAEFEKYFKSLKPDTHSAINPWFKDYWSQQFRCTFDNTNSTSGRPSKKGVRICTGNETFSAETGTFNVDLNVYSVMDAVYAFAYAAKALGSAYGCTKAGCVTLDKINGTQVLQHLKKVSFVDPADLHFKFNNNSGPPRYSLLRHVQRGSRYTWEQIGNYTGFGGPLSIRWTNLDQLTETYRKSVCSEACTRGQAKSVTNKCCWNCITCREFQYATTQMDNSGTALSSELCIECPNGQTPDSNKTGCDVIPETTMNFGEPWAIISIILSSLGLIVTVIMGVIFYKAKDTPIIMASGKELSFVLLIGIFMSYVSSFVFVAFPNVASCGATRLMLGLCYTLCYAAILVKTNRIYRVFNIKTKKPKKVKFIDAKSQLLITFIIVMVELASLITWIVFDPPEVINVYPSRSENVRVCEDSKDFAYLGALVYPFFLMILCVVYAVKTRKTPDGFNETRYITFGSYSFCIMWIAFISIYFTVKNNTIRIVALCFASTVNATVTLITLFVTKSYVVMFQPQKNTKEKVMSRRRTHSYETVDINHMSNLSRMVSAVSTWHSVYPGTASTSQISSSGQPQSPPKGPGGPFGSNLSISVVAGAGTGSGSNPVGSTVSIPSVFNNGPSPRGGSDTDVMGLAYRTKSSYSEDGVLNNKLKFDDIVNNHVLTRSRENLDDEGLDVPKLHQRRSLRSMKSRRRRRRNENRPRSAEISPSDIPNIVVTTPSDRAMNQRL